jgi:hypothetical protein
MRPYQRRPLVTITERQAHALGFYRNSYGFLARIGGPKYLDPWELGE